MAKHLPSRRSALPPWRAALMPALMWLILLTIFPARLHAQSAEEIKILQPSIEVPRGMFVYLSHLIDKKVVEGIPSGNTNYIVESSDPDVVQPSGMPGGFMTNKAGTAIVTFTHNDFPEISFPIEVTVRYNSPSIYLRSNIGTIYAEDSKAVTIPDGYLPLSDFTLSTRTLPSTPDAKLEYEVNGNQITLTGVTEGSLYLTFTSKFVGVVDVPVEIITKPSAEDIQVHHPSIELPIGNFVYLSDLVEKGYVEGIPSDYTNYNIEFSDPNVARSDKAGRFITTKAGTVIVTFTHKDFPEISFPIEVTARYECPSRYIQSNLRTLYIGTSQTFTIPNEYLPLSDFDLSIYDSTNSPDAKFEYVVNGNEITLTGLRTGSACLQFDHKEIGIVQVLITIVPKPNAENIAVKKDPIFVNYGAQMRLSHFIDAGDIEGISTDDWQNYRPSCDDSGVVCGDNYFSVGSSVKDPVIITYTNKEFPEIKFDITVVGKMHTGNLFSEISVYVNQPKTITVTDDYMPLSEFKSIELATDNGEDPYEIAKLDVDIANNAITLTGIKTGRVRIVFTRRYIGAQLPFFNVVEKPLAENIKVKRDYYYFPLWSKYLFTNDLGKNLVEAGEIEGVSTSEWDNYIPSCDNSNLVIQYDETNDTYSVMATSTGTCTVTYTNKFFPNVKFSINYIVRQCIDEFVANYFAEQFGTGKEVYTGQKVEVQLTEDCIPLSAYTILELMLPNGQNTDSIAIMEVDPVGNKFTFTGVGKGGVVFHFMLPILNTKSYANIGFGMYVREKPTVEEEPEIDANGEGEILTNVNQKVKVVVPKAIAEAAGDQPLIWKSSNENIATVDENGVVSPTALGLTILTASIENTASRANETVLMTLEFWVTDLIAKVPETISVGSTAEASYIVDAGKDSYDKDINAEWSSSDPSVVEIDEDGKMTGVAEGTATITLKTDIGTKTVTVTVEPPVTSLSINPSDVTLTVGSRLSLSTKGAGGKKVIWRTSDSFVAQIDENGVITGIASGTAIITATIEGTSTQATTRVTVFERTTGIEETEASEPVITVDNMTISVSGIDSDFPVEIYNVSGRLIASRKGSCSVAVDQTGIYIVRTGATARKVAVTR